MSLTRPRSARECAIGTFFVHTSGILYKEKKLKDTLPTMSEQEQYQLLATDGMLVKRPIVVTDTCVLVGFKEAEWEEKLMQTENAD